MAVNALPETSTHALTSVDFDVSQRNSPVWAYGKRPGDMMPIKTSATITVSWRHGICAAAVSFLALTGLAPGVRLGAVAPALAQRAEPAADGTLQLTGSRVVLRPASGLKSMPGAPMMTGRDDGMTVMVDEIPAGQFDANVATLKAPAWQKQNGLSNVKVTLRPNGKNKRAFLTASAKDGGGETQRQMLVIDNGTHAAMVISWVPRSSFEANPAVDKELVQMLETVSLTDKIIASAYDFKIDAPKGFTRMGPAGGQTQAFGQGDSQILLAIRMEKPAPAEGLAELGKRVLEAATAKQLKNVVVVSEVIKNDGRWEYVEREVKGTFIQTGAPAVMLARLQANPAREAYIVLGIHAGGGAPASWQTGFRKAFDSVTTKK
jgi:hypothetical protein